jgi:hypothetical protein
MIAGIGDLKLKLGLPPLHQIGVVVKDISKVVEYYSSIFGIGPFTVYEFIPDKQWFMGELTYFKAIYGKAMIGDIELCIMQPVEGRSIHNVFLETHGEGLMNLGFYTPEYEEMYERFLKLGFEPVARAESYVEPYRGYLKGCYFDTRSIGGVLIEIMFKSWLKKN